MRKTSSLEGAYFEELYKSVADPWKFASSPYERAKYADTLAALAPERSRSALEIGCSIGVLTRELAGLCDALVATEISQTALDAARERCADAPNVIFKLANGVAVAAPGPFDLVVISEVLYYWDDDDLSLFADSLKSRVSPNARLMMVHWLGETDYPQTADEAVEKFAQNLRGLVRSDRSTQTNDYRMDLWRWVG